MRHYLNKSKMKTSGLFSSLKLLAKSNYFLFKALRKPLVAMGVYKNKLEIQPDEFWQRRIEIVLESPDNKSIERVPDAGNIKGDVQLMHNGVKVHVGSYYGDGNTVLLHRNRGVHEPQEEFSFDSILEFIPRGGVMLELGAFWGFYSMTFLHKVDGGRCFLVEPDKHALLSGKNNFKLNKLKGKFFNFFISDISTSGDVPTITVTEFLQRNEISHLSILHSDIQGYELKMLVGANAYLKTGKIDYVFISTHSNELHQACKAFLIDAGYLILCDADLDETYSWDGLIVARYQSVIGPDSLAIHKRK
jgi:Methyltransferase FkbM domain